MSKHSDEYATSPTRELTHLSIVDIGECPYLPNRYERHIVISSPNSSQRLDFFAQKGFRHLNRIIYRPACQKCTSCIPIRIPVKQFRWSRRWRAILNRNNDLTMHDCQQNFHTEHYQLFQQYITQRHGGRMQNIQIEQLQQLLSTHPCSNNLFAWYDKQHHLVSAIIVEKLLTGWSAIYAFRDTQLHKRSLGNLMILALINQCIKDEVEYCYLGYFVPGGQHMQYKQNFTPFELYINGQWQTYKKYPPDQAQDQ